MIHGTLSYWRRMRYEILVRCDFDIFGAFRLFAACIIFLAKDFCLDPTVCGIWLILYLCSTISYRGKKIWDWFAFVCINEENIENFGLRENYDVKRSRLFIHEVPRYLMYEHISTDERKGRVDTNMFQNFKIYFFFKNE